MYAQYNPETPQRPMYAPPQSKRNTKMCWYTMNQEKCPRAPGTCWFAHTQEELVLPECRYGDKCRFKETCRFRHVATSQQSVPSLDTDTFPVLTPQPKAVTTKGSGTVISVPHDLAIEAFTTALENLKPGDTSITIIFV
jgi:hypothetical protein